MSTSMDIKFVVKNIIKTYIFGEILLTDLEEEFQSYEGYEDASLSRLVKDLGFDGLTTFLKSIPELIVFGKGLNSKVRFTDSSDIMNRSSNSESSSRFSHLESQLNNTSVSSFDLSLSTTSSTSSSTSDELVVMKYEIPEQNMSELKVGAVMKVLIHNVNDLDQLFFYLKKEFIEIRSFLKTFNAAYECVDVQPNKDFSVGSFVATFADENYCRGKIIEELEDGKSFKIFLVDFGIVIERRKVDILKLLKKFTQRQAAVYSGRFANIPEHVYIKTKEQLYEKVRGKFVSVKILKIDGKFAEILLIDQ